MNHVALDFSPRQRATIVALRATVLVLSRLPRRTLRRLSGPPIVRDGKTLDLQVQLLLALAARTRAKETHELPVAEGRREFRFSTQQVEPRRPRGVTSEDRIAAPGELLIPVRIYRPESVGPRSPAIVFFHGGGFVIGDLDSHDTVCATLCARARAVVIAVDYRLAPEHRFPAAVEDALAAYDWVVENAASLGIDATRIGLAGDSAGGNLSAVVAQAKRKHPVAPPRAQALIYPATDMQNRAPSRKTFGEGFLLSRPMINWFKLQYLETPASAVDPRVSPLLADDLTGVAPALVVTAGFDPLLDEGRAYADRLEQAGVRVKYTCFDGLVHGFVNVAGVVDEAARALDEIGRYLELELRV